MKIAVRLFAGLREKLPDAPRGRASLELPDGASLWTLLQHLDIPPELAQMVLVNGVQTRRERAEREAHLLEEDDTIAIFPPLAGG